MSSENRGGPSVGSPHGGNADPEDHGVQHTSSSPLTSPFTPSKLLLDKFDDLSTTWRSIRSEESHDQSRNREDLGAAFHDNEHASLSDHRRLDNIDMHQYGDLLSIGAVSYTHLTLPTKA